jgi:hypothetical protein
MTSVSLRVTGTGVAASNNLSEHHNFSEQRYLP